MLRPLGLCVLILSFVACDDVDDFVGATPTNSLPTTRVTATPPVLEETGSAVEFHWTGEDFDGQVVGFEWKMTDNGPDGIADPEDIELAPWHFTTATDSIFRVSADLDSFPGDGDGAGTRSWQTHTFFVRAVDDDGGKDPSPADVSFTAVTLAPQVRITRPPPSGYWSCRGSPPIMRFEWEASDPDAFEGEVVETRHLLLPLGEPGGRCLDEKEFETHSLIRADSRGWSPWQAHDGAAVAGIGVTFESRDLGEKFLFAVQARDASGATTSTFHWNENVNHVEIRDIGPRLIVNSASFTGTKGSFAMEFMAGSWPTIRWYGDGGGYGGVITGYRHGWNIVDPQDDEDPGWLNDWGVGASHQSVLLYPSWGTHTLMIECRDDVGGLARVQVLVAILQPPALEEQLPLLVVDDWRELNYPDPLDQQWDEMLLSFVEGRVRDFQRGRDFLEARTEEEQIDLTKLARYRGILWFGNPDSFSFLSRYSRNWNRDPGFINMFDVYQAHLGNLMLVGPGVMGNTLGQHSRLYPIELTAREWAYQSWCVDLLDRVRPSIGYVWGEHDRAGVMVRSKNCDGLYRAILAEEFQERFPAAVGVRDLEPAQMRHLQDPMYRATAEEFYNFNATTRPILVEPRSCQFPMYRWLARRDYDDWMFEEFGEVVAPIVPDDSLNCLPLGSTSSALDKAPTGLISSVYSDQKRIRGSHDFLWGFHPLSFEVDDVAAALDWILLEDWRLPSD